MRENGRLAFLYSTAKFLYANIHSQISRDPKSQRTREGDASWENTKKRPCREAEWVTKAGGRRAVSKNPLAKFEGIPGRRTASVFLPQVPMDGEPGELRIMDSNAAQ